MYAVDPAAKNSRPTLIWGAAQKTTRNPSISGWRTSRYSNGIRNPGASYRRSLARAITWRSPNRSKWSIANVLASTSTQPARYTVHRAVRDQPVTDQTGCGSGRHRYISSTSTRVDASTYVLRSAGWGTRSVHRRLNHG